LSFGLLIPIIPLSLLSPHSAYSLNYLSNLSQSSWDSNLSSASHTSDATFLSRFSELPNVRAVFGEDLTGEEPLPELLIKALNFYLAPMTRNTISALAKLDEVVARVQHLENLIVPVLFMAEDSPQNKFGILVAKDLLLRWQFLATKQDILATARSLQVMTESLANSTFSEPFSKFVSSYLSFLMMCNFY